MKLNCAKFKVSTNLEWH